jgi:hypothetical protein
LNFDLIDVNKHFFIFAEAWLIFPDLTSTTMETALQWFYDVSSDNINTESFDILENVFGIPIYDIPRNEQVTEESDEEIGLSTLEVENEDEWSLFCEKDSTTR